MESVKKTSYHSWCNGPLTEGCKLCVEGRKLVLFITGLCGQRCFYCPVNEEKFGSDVIYANEWKVMNPDNPYEILEEARLTGAKGAGITGGDPLVKTDRTSTYIKMLKKEYGKNFHVHLYTPLLLVNEERLKKLFEAGLDEIRFHPDLNDEKHWNRILIAKKFKWKIGVEIPCIPGYEEKTKKLIDFLEGKISFLNLNELERSDTNSKHYKLDEMGYKQRNSTTYGVKGSRELGMKLLKYARTKEIDAHFCTGKLKDFIQVGNRLKIRARNAAHKFDVITDEGLLIRGAIYLKGYEPGYNYTKILEKINPEKAKTKLEAMKKKIIKETKLEEKEIKVDLLHGRLIVPADKLRIESKKIKNLKYKAAVVEEYPTVDAFPVEIEFVS